MTVKARVGRTRYVAFEVEAARAPSRREFLAALRGLAGARWGAAETERAGLWLAAFDGRLGLLKVKHWSAKQARELLVSLTRIGKEPVSVRTLGTSGTARAARRRWLAGLVEG